MKIKVLGSSGARMPGHNLPAFLLDDFLLLDAGTSSCVLNTVAQQKISHALITHSHLDHINSIPFLVENMVNGSHKPPLTVISGKDVLNDMKKYVFNNRIWPDFTVIPNKKHPVLKFQELAAGTCMKINDYKVCTAKVNHPVPAYGYLIEDAKGKSLVYTGDTGPTHKLWEMMSGHDVKALIIEVAFPDSMKKLASISGHLTPSLLAEELKKMSKIPESIYITHINPVYINQVTKELKRFKKLNIEVINDKTIITI
ncbi:MAG: 3',5'-cyclic-nucleotide phosphodiesterase [Thermodesulfovibrionia bacterium]|nr:3',5'-cyclic-nucleotide phosphodiesterase [Thermodesulfovibrionia bacterium]